MLYATSKLYQSTLSPYCTHSCSGQFLAVQPSLFSQIASGYLFLFLDHHDIVITYNSIYFPTLPLWQIVTKQDRTVALKLQRGPGPVPFGSLMVHAEETVASKQAVELIFRCTHLENKDTFSKSVCFS
jgi:hypothetical protein